MLKQGSQLIKPKYLKPETIKKNIVEYVVDELKGYDITNKSNPELIKFIISVIENEITEKKIFEDVKNPKLEIFKAVCKKLYPNLSDSDLDSMVDVCEYLVKNKLFQKISFMKLIKHWIFKKKR